MCQTLGAGSNEEISENIVKKYQREYKEIISYKNVYYSNAILKELQGQLENTDNILQKYVNTYAGEDYIDVEVTLEVLENIGTKEKIVF